MFIFFDMDDTLIDHSHAVKVGVDKFLDNFLNELSYSREEFLIVWNDLMKKYYSQFIKGEISSTEQRRLRIREIFQHKKLLDEEADRIFQVYLKGYESGWKLFDDVVPCLENFKKENLGIITNGILTQQISKLTKLGIIDKFSVIISADDVKLAKPDPAIFLEACRRAKVDPKDAVYVGNNFGEDVMASIGAGMGSVWLNRGAEDQKSFPGPVISSLQELKNALKSSHHKRL